MLTRDQGLDALATPLLHLHTQANVELPWSTIDMDFMNLNQAAHGDREFGYIATRLGVDRKTVVGHASDERVQAKIGRWARAATGWAEMHSLKLARFGDNMRNVAVTEGDKVAAQLRVFFRTRNNRRMVQFDVAVFYTLRDGLITEIREIIDTFDLVQQVLERDIAAALTGQNAD